MTAKSEQWADGPLPLITTPDATRKEKNKATWVATQMALVHNSFLRQVNSLYVQAPFVTKPEDIADFLKYAGFVNHAIDRHHHKEETVFFPIIEEITKQPGIMEENIEGHKSFTEGFHAWDQYIQTATPETFDAGDFRKLTDGFGNNFAKHMAEEIDTLVALEKYDQDAIYDAYNKWDQDIVDSVDKYTDFPLMMGGHDGTWEGSIHTWPAIPFFVPYVIDYWFSRTHRGAWRFSPCTVYGQRKPLEFISKAK